MSASKKNSGTTPDSATNREKSRMDDDAVSEALSGTQSPETRAGSVLPGPPIPPEVQAEVRDNPQGTSGRRGPRSKTSSKTKARGDQLMITADDIKEHMEVVGSDGEHVGTVDHCEGQDVIKLTKSDTASGGEHHYIPMAWVAKIDQQVHLAHPGNEARSHWS